ncbi:MAG: hypothetical protein F6K31_34370 [Symploca sp. SIO2G7]|nr:hypothetical protein [Symploca sp. SIO2G7]
MAFEHEQNPIYGNNQGEKKNCVPLPHLPNSPTPHLSISPSLHLPHLPQLLSKGEDI